LDERVARVEQLLEEVDESGEELVQALLEMYGEGLRRILARTDPAVLVEDELLSQLLVLHDLHPTPLHDRVRDALDSVRPYLESHGGDVEVVAIEDNVVRLRMSGSCNGCPSSTMTLKLAIEDAIQRMAPEVERVEAEGVSRPTLLQLDVSDSLRGDWETVGGLPELRARNTLAKEVAGAPLLFAALDENLYAFRNACPGCDGTLDALECTDCGLTFDARRAGRCLEQPHLSLEPLPLLTDDAGIVKVALPAGVGQE
jgi:Fe-S cluster biogenesis protein NfuA/nitrite reductase/ring-hydroxylating ferredoxin subunit